MLLLQIKEYIFSKKEVTLPELAVHFNLPESALEKMAEHWIQKNIIQKLKLASSNLQDNSHCDGCAADCAIKEVTKPTTTIILYRPYS